MHDYIVCIIIIIIREDKFIPTSNWKDGKSFYIY